MYLKTVLVLKANSLLENQQSREIGLGSLDKSCISCLFDFYLFESNSRLPNPQFLGPILQFKGFS